MKAGGAATTKPSQHAVYSRVKSADAERCQKGWNAKLLPSAKAVKEALLLRSLLFFKLGQSLSRVSSAGQVVFKEESCKHLFRLCPQSLSVTASLLLGGCGSIKDILCWIFDLLF